jgi:hypothetical protein
MKPLVIYHANCADGFGAAFAAWLVLGDEAEYLPRQYGEAPPPGYADREVYILDFSFPRAEMEDFFRAASRVVWLDHHKTAFEMWCGPGYLDKHEVFRATGGEDGLILLDNNKSGAYLAWEYFHPGTEAPMLIRHIDDYDRWVFALDETKPFIKALWSYAPWSFEGWKAYLLDLPKPYSITDAENWHEAELRLLDMYYSEGAAILRAHEQNVQAVVKGAVRECCLTLPPQIFFDPVDGKPIPEQQLKFGLAANCPPHLTSDVGHELANQSGTFALCWTINKDGKCICSLRSNGEYDVSAIAKAFGGGGHPNAAGFEVDIQTLLGWIKVDCGQKGTI